MPDTRHPPSVTRIGFIGLGTMGGPMALNLLKAGHEVAVYNRSAAKCAPLARAGAVVAERDISGAEVSVAGVIAAVALFVAAVAGSVASTTTGCSGCAAGVSVVIAGCGVVSAGVAEVGFVATVSEGVFVVMSAGCVSRCSGGVDTKAGFCGCVVGAVATVGVRVGALVPSNVTRDKSMKAYASSGA